jgi:long-chain acyl-CoA synthetase
MLIHDFLRNSALAHPEKVALIKGEQKLTYSNLDTLSSRLANGLKSCGVKRGDRVAVYLTNCTEAVVSIFGIAKADAVFVVINRMTKPEKLAALLADCGAAALITDLRATAQGLTETLASQVASVGTIIVCGEKGKTQGNGHGRVRDFEQLLAGSPDSLPPAKNIELDLACLIYTSGTTGESKGVMCDHGNVVFVTQANVSYLKNSERDIVMNVLPLAFSYGLYQLMAMVCVGGTLVLEDSFAFPDLILEKMAAERVTGFAGVPTIYAMMLTMDLTRFDLTSLRYLTNAAAGLPLDHVRRLRQLFPKVALYLMHGLTEVARTMYLPPDQVDARPGSSGIPIPGTELWIADDNGERLGPDQVGELIVRGRHVMRGYWQAPAATENRFRPGPIPGERVCHTGDLFRQDADGYFYFISRKDDIIKSRGEKVAPREVENAIYTLTGVRETAVIGVADPVMGQVIKAFVVASGVALTEKQVIAHCKSRLEDFMVPRHVEFRSELPKTSSGKIRRMDLI